MNIYWKTACAVGLMTVGFLGGWYVNGNCKDAQITAIQAEYSEKEQKALDSTIAEKKRLEGEISALTADIQKAQKDSTETTDKLKKELKNASKKNPLPDSCRLDADRLSILKQAISNANGSSKTGR